MSRTMKDSGIEWIGEIPEDWDVQNLKSILAERKENNNPIKTDFILSLTNDRGVIPYTEKGDIGNKSKDDLTGYKLAHRGDIVLNSMNVIIGSVGLSNYFGAVSPVYYMLYPRDKKDSIEYYNHVFQTKIFQENLKGYGNGILAHRMRIPMIKLNTVILPSPSATEQQKIANFLDQKVTEIDHIIDKTKLSIEEYKKYKQSLITETVTKGLNPDVKMKNSGNEWIGEIPEHWEIKKTKYTFFINKDIAGKEGFNILSVTQSGLKIKDISSNEGQIAADYSKYQFVNKGDFVMNHMDLLTGWVDCSRYEGVTSPDYRVFKFIIQDKHFYSYYRYIFQMCYTNKIFYGLGQGVSNLGRWRLQTDKFLNFILPIPPKHEQVLISNYLELKCSEIDTLITQKETLLTELESYKKSLIFECVTGKREVV